MTFRSSSCCKSGSKCTLSTMGTSDQRIVCFVPGFLGGGVGTRDSFDQCYWPSLDTTSADELASTKWHIIYGHPSPVGSLHDRACQLFYELRGGRVQYGKEHSRLFAHRSYGPELTGQYPSWSASNPIHFIGHSLGGNTIRYMLQLIKEGHFHGENCQPSASWIASITCISSPLNGCLCVYGLGGDIGGSPRVRWGSGGFWLSFWIAFVEGHKSILYGKHDLLHFERHSTNERSSLLSSLDFGLDHYFRFDEDAKDDSSITESCKLLQGIFVIFRIIRLQLLLLRQFAFPTIWGWARGAPPCAKKAGFHVFTSPDNLAFDAQVASALAFNERVAAFSETETNNRDNLKEDENVYFFSVTADLQQRWSRSPRHSVVDILIQMFRNPLYQVLCFAKTFIYTFLRFLEPNDPQQFPADLRPTIAAMVGGEAHDGVVPTCSQIFPRLRSTSNDSSGACTSKKTRPIRQFQAVSLQASETVTLERGVWFYETIPGVDHLGIVGFPSCSTAQANFFKNLLKRLSRLPSNSADSQQPHNISALAAKNTVVPLPWESATHTNNRTFFCKKRRQLSRSQRGKSHDTRCNSLGALLSEGSRPSNTGIAEAQTKLPASGCPAAVVG